MTDENTPTTADLLMDELAATLEALVEHTMERVAQPPRGTIAETGHFRALNAAFKRKEYDALRRLLDDFGYNVMAALFATLDGIVEGDDEEADAPPALPRLVLVEADSRDPISDSLLTAFQAAWDEYEASEN